MRRLSRPMRLAASGCLIAATTLSLFGFVIPVLADEQGDVSRGRDAKQIWFDDLEEPLNVERPAAEKVLQYARRKLATGRRTPEIVLLFIEDRLPRIVFISASDSRNPARVAMGRGLGFAAAFDDALEQLSKPAWELPPVWFKLDLVTETVGLPKVDLDYPLVQDRSFYGLAFRREVDLAFLPDQVMVGKLIDRHQTLDLDAIVQFLKHQDRDAQVLRKFYQPVDHPLFRFRTQSYFWSEETGVLPLFRGHRIIEEFTTAELSNVVKRGGAYLTRAVRDDGRFIYHYDPASGEDVEHYNIVRHAGALYSMYELFEMTKDPQLLAAADRACAYLLAHAKPSQVDGIDVLCIVKEDDHQLGSNALSAIALAKRIEATGERKHEEALRKLVLWMTATQRDDGEFGIHKQVFSEGRVVPFISQYYPGEALLALTRMYRVDGNPVWLDAAEAGAAWVISVRDGELDESELIHDHWLLYALSDLYTHRPKPLYLEHTRKLCRSILAIQHLEPREADWYGGYYHPPRSTPVATRNEGLSAAHHILTLAGDEALADEVLTAIRRGIRFQLQTQYDPPSAMHVPDPQYVLGAFRGSLTDFTVRNDYTQHNISSMIRLLAILQAQDAADR